MESLNNLEEAQIYYLTKALQQATSGFKDKLDTVEIIRTTLQNYTKECKDVGIVKKNKKAETRSFTKEEFKTALQVLISMIA